MKLSFVSIWLSVVLLISCNDVSKKNTLTIFKDIHSEDYESNVEELALSNNNPKLISVLNTQDLVYSELFDTITYIKLSNEPEALVGVIDKIVLGDSCVYILDRYKTKSIKKFSLKGDLLSAIGNRGEGPEEYIEPTDFIVYENEVIVYDQFKSDLKYYDLDGHLKHRKKLPFLFLKLALFSSNHYVFQAVDADNDHLQSIVNYSIFESDSTFVLNKRGFYRPKNLYVSLMDNNFYQKKDKILYHPTYNDTIYSISQDNHINIEYVFNFQGKKILPIKYQLQENRRESIKIQDTDEYVFFSGSFVPTKNYLYFQYSIKHAVYQGIYSNKTNKLIVGHNLVNDMNAFFQFSNILTSTEDDVLVGYTQTEGIEDNFKRLPREEWVNAFGEDFIKEIEVIKDEDNPILLFFKLKDF
jgi:hypothetical protein